MKFKFLLILLFTLFCACKNTNKKYEYIEYGTKESILGGSEAIEKEAFIINAKNDSLAYLEAYEKFCISEKVAIDMQKKYGITSTKPIDFKLLDETGNDISILINFEKIDLIKDSIRLRIFNLRNSSEESLKDFNKNDAIEFKNKAKIDSVKVKKLSTNFIIKKDEFDPNGKVWYTPKSAPKYTNRNGIYCYFQTFNGMPSNLRLRLQYHSDDWLFFKKVQFSIDGNAFEYIPLSTETDSGNGGMIWEWFDESMNRSNTDLLNALSNAKSAKMKLIGTQYYDVKTISLTEIKAIKNTIELFNAMGGEY